MLYNHIIYIYIYIYNRSNFPSCHQPSSFSQLSAQHAGLAVGLFFWGRASLHDSGLHAGKGGAASTGCAGDPDAGECTAVAAAAFSAGEGGAAVYEAGARGRRRRRQRGELTGAASAEDVTASLAGKEKTLKWADLATTPLKP